ncbi:MAG TPA: hypothetical protein VHR97_00450 [Candidatus Baltobacteraceae bacterium]|nr:hypothetical protein [Candidatus Baltobacteraceae bacterium]
MHGLCESLLPSRWPPEGTSDLRPGFFAEAGHGKGDRFVEFALRLGGHAALLGGTPVGLNTTLHSGNLAVANVKLSDDVQGNLAIFQNAEGTPTKYSTTAVQSYNSATYDSSGNVFVLGVSPTSDHKVIELPKGSSTFMNISITGKIKNPRWLQWDGSQLAFLGGNELNGSHAHPIIYRVSITGSSGVVTDLVRFKSVKNAAGGGFWIQGNSVVVPAGHKRKFGWELGIWNYPAGGKATTIIKAGTNHLEVSAVSVSTSGHI